MNEPVQPAPAKERTKTSTLLGLTTFIAVTSFLMSSYNFYVTSIRHTSSLFVSQDGLGHYVSKKRTELNLRTNDFAQMRFFNLGNKPMLVEDVSFVAFQPGPEIYNNDTADEYKQAPKSEINRFDNQHCAGHPAVFRLNVESFELKAGAIEVRNLDFQSGTDVGTGATPRVISFVDGEDKRRHSVATLAITEENAARPLQEFVYCVTVRARNADGKRFVVSRPLWYAGFRQAPGDADQLEDHAFAFLYGLDTNVIEEAKLHFLE